MNKQFFRKIATVFDSSKCLRFGGFLPKRRVKYAYFAHTIISTLNLSTITVCYNRKKESAK